MNDLKQQELVDELKKRMSPVDVLPDEPDFFSSNETLLRYLKAREWDIDEAEKQLKSTVEWRRTMKPLTLDCRWCHERLGYHSMRQVGFDQSGRPVIYSCFAQAAVRKLTVEDAIAHVTYLIENAKVTMPPGVPSWVFVFDCTGMTLPSCNPKLGYSVTQIMSTHYPERLGLAICVNHSPVFQGIWNAIKVFLHPNTVAKMSLVRGKKKVRETFDEHFSEELRDWLLAEMKLNKQEPLPQGQLHFWEQPKPDSNHDPRGCPSYVKKYVDAMSFCEQSATSVQVGATCSRTHKVHPNIIDAIHNRIKEVLPRSPRPHSNNNKNSSHDTDSNSSDTDQSDKFEELEISEEYQIPENSEKLPGLGHTSDTKPEANKAKKSSNKFFLAI